LVFTWCDCGYGDMLCHIVPDREETQEGEQMNLAITVILWTLAILFIAVTIAMIIYLIVYIGDLFE